MLDTLDGSSWELCGTIKVLLRALRGNGALLLNILIIILGMIAAFDSLCRHKVQGHRVSSSQQSKR